MSTTTPGSPLTVLSEDETLFRDSVRAFAEAEIVPIARSMDQAGRYDAGLLPKLFEMGLMGIDVPESYGGSGGTFFQACLAVEELSYADAAVGVLVDVQNTLVNNAVERHGTAAQKQRTLARTAKDTVASYCLSEAGSGSDAFALQCKATKDGNAYRLDGHKLWITNAAEAEIFLVFATLDPKAGYKGITAFLVEKSDPGFSLGKREDKLGIRASSTCEILFDGCRIPADRLLGEEGKGYKLAIETLNEGRIGIGAQMLGVGQAALDASVRYAKERVQFGKLLSDFQAMRFQLADSACRLEAARLLVYNAARLRDAGLPFVREAAMAKLFASEAAEMICARAVEVLGGNGYTSEYPVEKYYRDVKIGKIYEGTTFMQLSTIAKALLD
ncbi:MAG TPA: acyl-CoA dehydrogenase family protein [Candidatus Polarisedimenticolaceae bacterium]|nr:acyl-CoA dehydrogenase family protein [Candidatus Polarisedimenticolaceae bacterium]